MKAKTLFKNPLVVFGLGAAAGYLLRNQIAQLLPASLAPTSGLGAPFTFGPRRPVHRNYLPATAQPVNNTGASSGANPSGPVTVAPNTTGGNYGAATPASATTGYAATGSTAEYACPPGYQTIIHADGTQGCYMPGPQRAGGFLSRILGRR